MQEREECISTVTWRSVVSYRDVRRLTALLLHKQMLPQFTLSLDQVPGSPLSLFTYCVCVLALVCVSGTVYLFASPFDALYLTIRFMCVSDSQLTFHKVFQSVTFWTLGNSAALSFLYTEVRAANNAMRKTADGKSRLLHFNCREVSMQ